MPFKPSNYKMDWTYSVLLGPQSGTVYDKHEKQYTFIY